MAAILSRGGDELTIAGGGFIVSSLCYKIFKAALYNSFLSTRVACIDNICPGKVITLVDKTPLITLNTQHLLSCLSTT